MERLGGGVDGRLGEQEEAREMEFVLVCKMRKFV